MSDVLKDARDRWLKVYADGGVVSKNPSTIGGTWAFIVVDAQGGVKEESGFFPVGTWGLETVSNNVSELVAVMMALRSLPDGSFCDVHTDSQITLRRCVGGERAKWNGVPDKLRALTLKHLGRLSGSNWVLLAGHPSHEELKAGFKTKESGSVYPVSRYNVRCDALCGQEARAAVARLEEERKEALENNPQFKERSLAMKRAFDAHMEECGAIANAALNACFEDVPEVQGG